MLLLALFMLVHPQSSAGTQITAPLNHEHQKKNEHEHSHEHHSHESDYNLNIGALLGGLFVNETGAHAGVSYPMGLGAMTIAYFVTPDIEVGLEGGLALGSSSNGHGVSSSVLYPIIGTDLNYFFGPRIFVGTQFVVKHTTRWLTFVGGKFGKDFHFSTHWVAGPEIQVNCSLDGQNPLFELFFALKYFL